MLINLKHSYLSSKVLFLYSSNILQITMGYKVSNNFEVKKGYIWIFNLIIFSIIFLMNFSWRIKVRNIYIILELNKSEIKDVFL